MSQLALDTAGPIAVEADRRAAECVILAMHSCDAEGEALNEVQLGLVLGAVIQAFDGYEAAVASMLTIGSKIRCGGALLRRSRT